MRRHRLGKLGQRFGGRMLLEVVPERRVTPTFASAVPLDSGSVENGDVRGGTFSQPQIEALDEARTTAHKLPGKISMGIFGRQIVAELDDVAAEGLRCTIPELRLSRNMRGDPL